jgi:uncharacterized protein YjbI with pentapeptide repeats
MAQHSEINNSLDSRESRKKSSHLFFIYLFTLIYVLITALSITHIQMLLNDRVILPIIGVGVNITFFIVISPLVLITLFTIYSLHYLHLKNSSDKKITFFYYWPIYEFGKFEVNNEKRFGLNFLQSVTSNFIIWALLPLTLFVISFIYLPSHELVWTTWIIICSALGNFLTAYFWIKNDENSKTVFNRKRILVSAFKGCILLATIFYIATILFYNTALEITGYLINSNKDIRLILLTLIIIVIIAITITLWLYFRIKELHGKPLIQFFKLSLFNVWILILLSPLIIIHYTLNTGSGKNRNLDLSYQIISQNPDSPHGGIYSVDLRSKDLRYASLIAAVLSKADMRRADLRYTGLYSARVDSSNLEEANFERANLKKAIFNYAIMENANLSYTDLRGVHFGNTNLRNANLAHSDLRNAKLLSAILDSADLSFTDLRGAEIDYTHFYNLKSLYNAKMDSSVLEDIQNHFEHLLKKN